ncbi:TRAP transporter large permease [Variovorax defluvii]|uniref:TRAP transporter large permease protein n=1 Tax=Variovorax defluvii TaxID=913761 RepID=A0ABP8I0W6_9BURK
MTIIVLTLAFILLVLVGIPISFAMGISSLVALFFHGQLPYNLIVHRTLMGVDSFVLLAIPLFIFAGTIMEQGGISEKLVRFAQTLLGRFRGGLPMVVVGSTMLQSGISGSTVADVSAMSAMTLEPLEKEGYSRPYSLSVIGSSCAFAILIPPCILMVIVAAVANTSVVAVFAAGIVPSILIGAMMLAFLHVQARIHNRPAGEKASFAEVAKGFWNALLALGVPILIFGGIRAGVATVTEMAAIAVLYSLVVGGLVYRRLSWRRIYDALVETCVSTGVITMLMGFAMIFGYLLATEGVPQAVASWMKAAEIPAWGVLVITAIIFVFVGAVLEGAPAVLIFVPILLPVVRSLGIDIVHWLTVVVLASGIGLFVPPTGLAVLVACSVGKVRMDQMIKPLIPFLLLLLAGLAVVIFVPWFSTALPQAMELTY